MLPDPKLMLGAFVPDPRGLCYLLARGSYLRIRRRMLSDFEIDERTVARAYDKLVAAGQRFRAARGPNGYLVAKRFTVADLTLALLITPLVAPPEFPYPQPDRDRPRVGQLEESPSMRRDCLSGRGTCTPVTVPVLAEVPTPASP